MTSKRAPSGSASTPHKNGLSTGDIGKPTKAPSARRIARRFLGLGALASLGLITAHQPARAQGLPGQVDPKLQSALTKALRSKGVEGYVGLREMWRRWERTDPTQVEEALATVATSSRARENIKVYARLLHSYARRRRGDVAGATAEIRKLGFINRWLVVGPFDNEAKASLFTPFGPEDDLTKPIAFDRAYEGKARKVRWRKAPHVFDFGWLDFTALVRPTEKVCAYAASTVSVKGLKNGKNASVWVGTSGAFHVFWNGNRVLTDTEYRALDADRFAAKIRIEPGLNRLVVKVCGDESGAMLQARIADRRGRPVPNVVYSDSLSKFNRALKNTKAKAIKRHHKAPGVRIVDKGDPYAKGATSGNKATASGVGPAPFAGGLAGLRKLKKAKSPSPKKLEAYARYLSMTGGDGTKAHLARDFAFRAAKKKPTVERLLLAGRLAENRNAEKEWVGKARKALKAGQDDSEVLLAEAMIARRGPNFRDATPYFDRLLEKDPDHLMGLLGRLELYEEAGLRYTALKTLEDAVRRRPKAIALLRAYAKQLRSVGKDQAARRIERRYSNYRYDDGPYLRSQTNLAINRRDFPAAKRWLQRLLSVAPDSMTSLAFAARSYRKMGEPSQTLRFLKRRLALAPEDVRALRDLADFHGEKGRRSEQLKLLRKILVLRPQEKSVREYVESLEPPKPRQDEAFAWGKARLLELAKQPAPKGIIKRTLRDLQVTSVFSNGLSSRFHQVVLQPLTPEGAAAARQYAFSFQGDTQIVDIRSAKVYHKNGKVDEAIEMGEGPADNPSIAMYTSARTYYIQLPRLEPQDVVELRYRVEDVTSRNEYGGNFAETAYMQKLEPIQSSEYVLLTPKKKKVTLRAPAWKGFARSEKDLGDTNQVRLLGKNIPAIVPEPIMPPLGQVALNASASTFASWDAVGAWYWGLAKDQFDVDDDVRKKVKQLTKGLKTNREKVRAIYNYVVQKTRYVALEFGIEGFRPRRCAQTLGRGWGDCKDKATVIVTMLRELGIKATIVLVRTGLRGDGNPNPPSYAFFDHAIAYVPSLDLYLDGTAEYTGMDELPPFDRGAWGLQINEGKPKLVRLPQPPSSATERMRKVQMEVRKSGGAKVELDLTTTGALAAQWRQRYHAKDRQRDRVQKDFSAAFGGFTLTKGKKGLKASDLEDLNQSVKLTMKGTATGIRKDPGGKVTISLSPSGSMLSRYAALSKRKYAVKLRFAYRYRDEWEIRLPQGVKVDHLPAPGTISSPFGTASMKVSVKGNKVMVSTQVSLDKTSIKPKDYASFRKFCADVDRVLQDSLVLK